MAKKETSPELTEEFKKTLAMTKVLDMEVDEELKRSFIAYAMAVNKSRAIPDVRDGLKPVHRRILFSMHEMGLYNDKSYRKCARIVGDTLGKYHPHGDSSVYDALVRLAQDFTINFPLVDGHGNFGSVDGDPAAAMRYTEARLTKLASEMLKDLDKETVDFIPNFDGNELEPTVLPARFPNLLVNGSDGIAVGMATNIPPHNLAEVIDGAVAMIDNPEITVDELMEYIPAPDFPTGGIIMGRSGIRNAYRTGQGKIVIRSKCEIEEYGTGGNVRQRIVVTEIPYQVNKAMLIKTIADMVKDKRLEGISDIREESDRDGMRIVIECKKDANAQVVLNTLYKRTNLQISDGIIMLALVENGTEPRTLNLREIFTYYLAHQKEVITRRTRYELNKTEERAHIVSGLVLALANIDEVIKIIKESSDKFAAIAKLTEAFELDEKQANAILEMRLQRLTSLEVDKLKDELTALEATIADLKDILAHEERVMAIIRADLIDIKNRYPSPRRTEISVDYGSIEDADLIDKEDVVISLTHSGYIKRLPVTEYKAQNRGGMGITAHKPKDEDYVEKMFISSTHDDILLFSSLGKVYSVKGYEIPEANRTSRKSGGEHRASGSGRKDTVGAARDGRYGRIYRHRHEKGRHQKDHHEGIRPHPQKRKNRHSSARGRRSHLRPVHDGRQRADGRFERGQVYPILGKRRAFDGQNGDGRARDETERGRRASGYAGGQSRIRHFHADLERLRQAFVGRGLQDPKPRRQGHQGGRVQRKDGLSRQYEAGVGRKRHHDHHDGRNDHSYARGFDQSDRARDARRPRDERQGQPGCDGGRSGTGRRSGNGGARRNGRGRGYRGAYGRRGSAR